MEGGRIEKKITKEKETKNKRKQEKINTQKPEGKKGVTSLDV